MLARTSEAELALTSSTIDIEVIPVNSFDLIGMPHRHTDIVRNHKTRKLVAVDKDKLYRMPAYSSAPFENRAVVMKRPFVAPVPVSAPTNA